MVLVSTITIEGTPGSTISVTEVRDEGGRITLVVRGAHVALANIVVEYGKETEQADKAVGTQSSGIQDTGAGDDQAAKTQQDSIEEEEEGEVIEAVNTSSPPSSLSSPSSVPISLCAMFSSTGNFSNEPFYRLLALTLNNLYKRSTYEINNEEREGGRVGCRG